MPRMKDVEGTLEPRRKPIQKRSRKREESVLEATKKLIETDGFDALTTSRIATKAKIPIGTVYYLFPNKYAIVARLLEQCMEKVGAIIWQPFEDLPWTSVLDNRIDALAEHWRHESGFSQMWKALRSCPELADTNTQAIDESVDAMSAFVRYALPNLEDSHQIRIATTIVHAADRLLEESLEQPDEASRMLLIGELKSMLKAYIQSHQ